MHWPLGYGYSEDTQNSTGNINLLWPQWHLYAITSQYEVFQDNLKVLIFNQGCSVVYMELNETCFAWVARIKTWMNINI